MKEVKFSNKIKMKCVYNQIITENGESAISFVITTRKGFATGLYAIDENKLFINDVRCNKGLKGIMHILINKFKTNLITFSPLITDGIQNKIRGNIKTMSSEDPRNPYGENYNLHRKK